MLLFYRQIILFVFLLITIVAQAQAQTRGYSLPDLIKRSLVYHPSIKASKSLQASAEQAIDGAKWQYFPTPKISYSKVSTSDDDVSYAGDDNVLIFSLSQPIWTAGKLDSSLERSKMQLESSRLDTAVAKREFSLQVVNAYSRWYSSYLKLESYKKSQANHKSLKERIMRRISQGLSSSSDLELVDSRLLQVTARLNSTSNIHTSALLKLQELVGEHLNTNMLVPDVSGDYAIVGEEKQLLEQAMLKDPKIKSILTQKIIAELNHKQAKAYLYPNINLRYEHQRGNFNSPNTDSENRLFLELASDFGAGLSSISRVKQAKAELLSYEFQLLSERHKIKQLFNSNWVLFHSLMRQKKLLEDAVKSSIEIEDSWYRQFLAGRKTWQDVMNSIRESSQLESQLADSIAESLLASWRLGISIKGIDAI